MQAKLTIVPKDDEAVAPQTEEKTMRLVKKPVRRRRTIQNEDETKDETLEVSASAAASSKESPKNPEEVKTEEDCKDEDLSPTSK